MPTVLDEFTRVCPAILVSRRSNGEGVVSWLARLMVDHGLPEHIRSDNGPEFAAEIP